MGEASRRWTRAGTKALSGFPVGQIVGSLDRRRPTAEVMREMVEEWIETTQRLGAVLED
nr:hypothetical protein [Parafrankia sp. CH37]